MRRHIEYLKYVLRHKWYVFLACMEHGVPVWIAILHDWDKFLPDEWFAYARTFYKPDGTKQYVPSPEFSMAWMKHQHRNKHHWQWWLNAGITRLSRTNVMVWDKGNASIIINKVVIPWDGTIEVREPMPDVYRREMLADWIGAGRAMGKPETWVWYEDNKTHIRLDPDTREWIETELAILRERAS